MAEELGVIDRVVFTGAVKYQDLSRYISAMDIGLNPLKMMKKNEYAAGGKVFNYLSCGRPVLSNRMGGVSGPALKPIALRCVYEIARAVHVPIIGTGGVSTGRDAAEMLMAGATAVGVGSAVWTRGVAALGDIAVELAEKGVLERFGVELLGTPLDSIRKAEDRELFKNLMQEIGEPVPESAIAESVEECLAFARLNGCPVIVRPAYIMPFLPNQHIVA